MSFVTLSKEQFEGILPNDWIEVETGYQELVYDIPTEVPEINVRVYSTVDKRDGQTRDKGEDAIRVVFWDMVNDRPLGKGKKVLRVEKATTIQERILGRIKKFMETAKDQAIVDFNYVGFILANDRFSKNNFAVSLKEQLKKRGSLSDKQLNYVLGIETPKGYPTFEQQLKNQYGEDELYGMYMDSFSEPDVDENEYEEDVTAQPTKTEKHIYTEPDIPVLTPGTETELVEADGYPFDYFNPIQSAVYPYKEEDCNIVLGASTSAGKTIAAELVMQSVLNEGKKVVYTSPLKSLSSEKLNDWTDESWVFKDREVLMLTGDTLINKKVREKQLRLANDADIIIMTSELLDSISRRAQSEQYVWLKQVGAVITDESHCISLDSRGDVIECALMRFTALNPNARVLFLSATMPNVEEFYSWLSALNGKDTVVINSGWRPVRIETHILEYPVSTERSSQAYWQAQYAKRRKAVEVIMDKKDEKFLVFVHDKKTGRALVGMLKDAGEESAEFHNADLNFEERQDIENSFKNRKGGIRVLVSTSTLAYGRNLPARNVVIVGVHRGINEVDELDIIQEIGRCGRYGIDPQGDAYLLVPQGTIGEWQSTLANPRPVTSVMTNRHVLAFHVLAEIGNGVIRSVNDLMKWFERSLAYLQRGEIAKEDAEGIIFDLEKMDMIYLDKQGYKLTQLGRVGSRLYYSPYDIRAWYDNFEFVNGNNYEDDDLVVAWALGNISTNALPYTPKDIHAECMELGWQLRNRGIVGCEALPAVLAITELMKGTKNDKNIAGTLRGFMRGITFDIERQVEACKMIDEKYAFWYKKDLWPTLVPRIQYGVSKELAPLVKIKGVGKARAEKLYKLGFKTVESLAKGGVKQKLTRVMRADLADKIVKEAKKKVNNKQKG